MIYRLPCRTALSVRKSLLAVRIAEQNKYTENTPPRDPAEGSKENENDFYFWLQISGVNFGKRLYFKAGAISKSAQPTAKGGIHAAAMPLAQGYSKKHRK